MRVFSNIIILALALIAISCTTTVRYASTSNSESKPKSVSKPKTKKPDIVKKTDTKKTHNTDIPVFDFSKYQSGNSLENKDLTEFIHDYTQDWIGTPYKWGGNTKSGVDCSGFTKNVFDKLGYKLPRTASQQHDFTQRVSKRSAQTGDLVFFREKGRISHVGIYLEDGYIVHASSSRGVIKEHLSANWLSKRFHSVGRINL
jgi:lipoprotein Spr